MKIKRLAALLLALCLLCGLTACGEKAEKAAQKAADEGQPEVQENTTDYNTTMVFRHYKGGDVTIAQMMTFAAVIKKRLEVKGITDCDVSYDKEADTVTARFSLEDNINTHFVMESWLTRLGQLQIRTGAQTDKNGNPTDVIVLTGSEVEKISAEWHSNGEGEPVSALGMTFTSSGTTVCESYIRQGVKTFYAWLDYGATWAKKNNEPRYQYIGGNGLFTLYGVSYGDEMRHGISIEMGVEKSEYYDDLINTGALPYECTVETTIK